MWQRITNFVRRHKRKVIVLGGLFGGIYIFRKFIASKLSIWESQQTKDFFDQMKRYHHFEGTLQTCDSTVFSLLPKIRETVVNILNVDGLVELLKSNPESRLETWEELKILVFVESIGEMTGEILLVCFLRVQLSIIGGYMYIDTQRNRTLPEENLTRELITCSQEVQQKYLACIHHFFGVGLPEIFGLIKDCVQNSMSGISLKDKLQLSDFHNIFLDIKQSMLDERSGIFRHLSNYLIPDTSLDLSMWPASPDTSEIDSFYQKMLLETKDILETNDFSLICKDFFDRGFANILEMVSSCVGNKMIPVAKIIPILHTKYQQLDFSKNGSSFVQDLLQDDPCKTFTANIYEAFSQPTDIDHNIRGTPNIIL